MVIIGIIVIGLVVAVSFGAWANEYYGEKPKRKRKRDDKQ